MTMDPAGSPHPPRPTAPMPFPPTGVGQRPLSTPIGDPSQPFGAPAVPSVYGIPLTTEAPETNLVRGAVFGLLAALAGGAIWYAIVVLTDRQFVYLALALGFLIGFAVTLGAHSHGAVTALVSALIAGIGVIGSYYYIDRFLILKSAEELGVDRRLPLVPRLDELREVLRLGFEAQGSQYLYIALCIAAAAYFGFKGSDRA